MSTQGLAKYARAARKAVPKPIPVVRGNCLMCAGVGKLGEACTNGCKENHDLCDGQGQKVKNDLSTSTAACKYGLVTMPDNKTQICAEWYYEAVKEYPFSADKMIGWQVKNPKHFFVLEHGCPHHLLILQIAAIYSKPIPPGNEAKKCSAVEN